MKSYRLEELAGLVGAALGESAPVLVDQARIDAFAAATEDRQWIHVDPARAADGPFGATVAHGFLTLSLLPVLLESTFRIDGARLGVNYGLNRVRFPAPVPAGSLLRGRFRLLAFEPVDGGAQLTVEATLAADGAPKPACVAEAVSRWYV
ncbi:MAG: MaoC family dehydratase [Piscinibacter sp.]|uniref:MaoC family dehydratase n=1 Tax=Piscinibacter TaxID=1114981 RepID=UPI000FDF3D58|nr:MULTISPECIES: MaoC family dehydratase [Piscinibacter]MCW5662217.1 MaoC family dehydratase [Piscinibacter sp.]